MIMSQSQVAARLTEALAKELKRDPASIQASHKLREDLGLNSLDAIELMFKVEEEFDLAIPDADLQKLVTVGDLITYIDGRLHEPKGAPAPSASSKPAAPPEASRAPIAKIAPKSGAAKKASAKPPKPAKKPPAAKGRRRA
jgi:acyl carrier protein